MAIRSYRYRINPTRAQISALSEMLRDFCSLYNAALEHRILAHRKGVSIKRFDQQGALRQIRNDLPHMARWSFTAKSQVIQKLDQTYSAFFRRVTKNTTAGFPRFKASDRYHAANFRVGDGLTIKKSGRIGFVGIPGDINIRWHRDLPSKPKSAILSRNGGKWYVIFHVDVAAKERSCLDSIGIDMGLTSLVALSNGETIARPNITKRNARKLRVLQRTLARAKSGSKGRERARTAVVKLQSRIRNSRRDNLHKLSASLVDRFGRIAIEDLNVKGLARGMLAKHVNDAAWSLLTGMLAYKAESAGCEIVKVDARGTSQTCPQCRTIAVKTLATRTHRCECGCTLDRDVAAAIVIHQRAFGLPPGVGAGQLTERVAA